MRAEDTFNAREELVNFYGRHFDELVEACIEVSSRKYRWSPLNTLSIAERRRWIENSFHEIVRMMTGESSTADGAVYYPRVSVLENSNLFGIADIIDSCECALLPDEGILPLLWQDYATQPDRLLAMVMEFRNAQNTMTKLQVRRQMEDFERYIEFTRKMAISEERAHIEEQVYEKFYLALRSLRNKTSELYEYVQVGEDSSRVSAEITQLKMMEADLLAEVFRINPDIDTEHKDDEVAYAESDSRQFESALDRFGITQRERDVFLLAIEGKSNLQIAEELGLAESTVKNHISNILGKIGQDKRSYLIIFAAKNGYFG